MTPSEKTAGEDRLQVSPADIAFLAVVFLLVCAVFAVCEGLGLGAGDAGPAARMGRGADLVRVEGFPDGHVEVQGRRVDLGDLRSAVESAGLGMDRPVVVAEYAAGTSPGLVADMLDAVKTAGVERILVRETRR